MKKIKLFSPKFDSKELSAAVSAIKSSHWASGDGKNRVKKFEKKFQRFVNSKECVAVDNGTAAIHLALNILDIKEKEVIVPSLTFVSTIHAILYNGGIPVFTDVNPHTLCIEPKDIQRKITKKTKVIIPVHFGGLSCDMNSIKKISHENRIHVVEDAAHACGAKYQGKKIGTHSELVCFSFHPVKNLAMPKGGAITINSSNIQKIKLKLNSLRWCGITNRQGPHYDVTQLGFNYYMDEISASIGIEQLKKLNESNKIRYQIAKRYYNELNISEKMPLDKNCSYHLFWILVNNRKEFMKKMELKNIQTGIHYNPVHLMSFYKKKIKLPITESIGKKIVTLPMHPNLTDNEIDRVVKTINSLT